MKPASFSYQRPASLMEAAQILASDSDAVAISGGQSLVPLMNLRMSTCTQLVDLARLPDLRKSTETMTHVTLGAGVTHAMIEDGLVPDPTSGMMRKAARNIAYRAVRCHGTIGGSVAMADPAADWPCILLALDATVLLHRAAGERKLPINDFLRSTYETALQPGEIIAAFEIPKLSDAAQTATSKVNRKTGAFADAFAVAIRDGARSRVCIGAIGTRAQILVETSKSLVSNAHEQDLAQLVEADIAGLVDAEDAYKRHLHVTTTRRALAEVVRR
jgi:carbon-monoxide dehydrogenase medium subunit